MTAIQDAIRALADGAALSGSAAAAALQEVMLGEATPAQIGAFLAALRVRGESAEVVAACLEVTSSHAEAVPAPGVMDIVGTGGDGADTFNVSTAAALVVAAAGVRVAKHGNRAASSKCGSADVIEALGGRLDITGEHAARVIDGCGFCFLFAQRFHPAMRHAGGPRRELGIRTIFNAIGPLSNPARPARLLVGSGTASLAPIMAEAFRIRGTERALVVHSADGLDEISPAGVTHAWLVQGGAVTQRDFEPNDFGLTEHPLESVAGGDATQNAATMRRLLAGETGAVRDFVLATAAAALWLAGAAGDLKDGVRVAAQAIDSGKAAETLARYVALSQEVGGG